MKMRPTPRPPTPRRVPKRLPIRRILPARAASSNDEVDDYEGDHEPSMKLSHAFIVVLLLHVLAVGGVFAFNTLKSNDREKTAAPEPVATKSIPAPPPAPAAAQPAPAAKSGPAYTVVAGDTLTRIASQNKTTVEALEKANGLEPGATLRVGQVLSLPTASSAPAAAATVAKAPVPVTVKPVSTVPPSIPTTPKAAEPKPAPAAPAAPAAAPSSGGTYVVEKGDNPYSIAKKLKVSYSELLKVNNIEDPKKLQIGQKLIVP